MTVSIKVINESLIEDFGFKRILWIYSGRRGVHCWVCDDRARTLTREGRRAIVGYLELLKGGKDNTRKVNTRGFIIHPHLNRSLLPCAKMFREIMMGKMKIFEIEEKWKQMLSIIPDEGIT